MGNLAVPQLRWDACKVTFTVAVLRRVHRVVALTPPAPCSHHRRHVPQPTRLRGSKPHSALPAALPSPRGHRSASEVPHPGQPCACPRSARGPPALTHAVCLCLSSSCLQVHPEH